MYKKILIPIDGSPISAAAAHAGVTLAKKLGAEIVGLYVASEYQYPIDMGMVPPVFPGEQDYKASMQKTGERFLLETKQAAEAAGLTFSGLILFSDSTAKQIVTVAEENRCDLIVMGSHGHSGWGQMLLGSVTSRVLSTCQIPVLVHRSLAPQSPDA